MRITKSIIKDLSILMIGFGVIIGVIFPFYTLLFGIDKKIALSPIFVASCIVAGALVGFINIQLTRSIYVKQMQVMIEKMSLIQSKYTKAAQGLDVEKCDFETCQLRIDSDDEFGESANAFNSLVETLSISMGAESLNSLLDKDGISAAALNQIMSTTIAKAGAILIETEGELHVAACFGMHDAQSLKSNKTILAVASTHQSVYINYPDDINMDGVITKIRPVAACVEPLEFNGSRLGACIVVATTDFSESEMDKLRLNIRNLSVALHSAMIHEQVQKLAAIDPLTGVLNRRFGIARLHDEYSRTIRTNIPMGIMMLDLDHFKWVNDQYGHLAGDRVLVTITKIIKELLREGDNILRYGGEEFMIILPGASEKDTFVLADKIRRVVEASHVTYGGFEIAVTCSIGFASFPECPVSSQEVLIKKVDEALYFAKENGRNQIKAVSSLQKGKSYDI